MDRRGCELSIRTAGGTSATVAIAVQMSPFTKKITSTSQDKHNVQELSPDLFPEEVGQTRGGTTVIAQAKQTNEHDEK